MQENTLIADQLAWSLIAERDSGTICRNAQVTYDPQGHKFIMQCFGQEVLVDIGGHNISSHSPLGQHLLHGLKHFFNLAAIWYLARAKNIPTSGRQFLQLYSVRVNHLVHELVMCLGSGTVQRFVQLQCVRDLRFKDDPLPHTEIGASRPNNQAVHAGVV